MVKKSGKIQLKSIKIAYVPGDVYLWPNLSGGETIDLFLKLHGQINKEKRDELIKKFDLNPKKKSALIPKEIAKNCAYCSFSNGG